MSAFSNRFVKWSAVFGLCNGTFNLLMAAVGPVDRVPLNVFGGVCWSLSGLIWWNLYSQRTKPPDAPKEPEEKEPEPITNGSYR